MKYTLLFSLVFALSACNKGDFDARQDYHSLTTILCECIAPIITPQQQQWRFDFDDSEIDVVITGDPANNLILEEGIYDFELTSTTNSWGGDEQLFRVNNRDFYIDFIDGGIQLSDPGAAVDAGSYYIFMEN